MSNHENDYWSCPVCAECGACMAHPLGARTEPMIQLPRDEYGDEALDRLFHALERGRRRSRAADRRAVRAFASQVRHLFADQQARITELESEIEGMMTNFNERMAVLTTERDRLREVVTDLDAQLRRGATIMQEDCETIADLNTLLTELRKERESDDECQV